MTFVMPLLTIHLVIAPTTAVSAAVLDAAVAEAAAIWEPFGIVLARDATDEAGPTLTVVVQDEPVESRRREGSGHGRPLGAVRFDEDGRPTDRIDIFLEPLRWVLRLDGVEARRSAPAAREILLGRAIGRVLSHEIGHFVLRFPAHSRTGLMAAFHSSRAFADPSRYDFELTETFAIRLQQAVRSINESKCALPQP